MCVLTCARCIRCFGDREASVEKLGWGLVGAAAAGAAVHAGITAVRKSRHREDEELLAAFGEPVPLPMPTVPGKETEQ